MNNNIFNQSSHVESAISILQSCDGIPFQSVLRRQEIARSLEKIDYRSRYNFYPPDIKLGKETGEHALLLQLFSNFECGDIAIADSYYASFFLLGYFMSIGVDFAFPINAVRNYDFRLGKLIGKRDHIVENCRMISNKKPLLMFYWWNFISKN